MKRSKQFLAMMLAATLAMGSMQVRGYAAQTNRADKTSLAVMQQDDSMEAVTSIEDEPSKEDGSLMETDFPSKIREDEADSLSAFSEEGTESLNLSLESSGEYPDVSSTDENSDRVGTENTEQSDLFEEGQEQDVETGITEDSPVSQDALDKESPKINSESADDSVDLFVVPDSAGQNVEEEADKDKMTFSAINEGKNLEESRDVEQDALQSMDASADENVVDSGYCGPDYNNGYITDVRWKLTGVEPSLKLTISGQGEMTDIFICHQAPWYPYRQSITTVTIEEGVTSIGARSFCDCINLKTITLPNSLSIISRDYLELFGNPVGVFNGCISLKSVSLPISVESIPAATFCGCNSLESVSIPGVTDIGDFAFDGCSSLKSISLPKELMRIGEFCFCSSGLTSITIPNGVSEIEYGAFIWCDKLSKITLPQDIYKIGMSSFKGCSSLLSISLPDTVTMIGDQAFCDCEKLENINIPEGVLQIGDSAFSSCNSLKSVNLPSGLTYLGQFAFNGSGLTSISIPNGIEKISKGAFANYRSLKKVSIANGITEICQNAFALCTSLTSVSIPGSVKEIGERAFSDCYKLHSIVFPEGLTSIGNEAFYNSRLQGGIILPGSVETIGSHAFSGNCLSYIELPNTINNIGEGAFSNNYPDVGSFDFTVLADAASYAAEYVKNTELSMLDPKVNYRDPQNLEYAILELPQEYTYDYPVTYRAKAYTPVPTVIMPGRNLKKNTDYTISYKNNTNAGTAKVTITGKGSFKGSVSTTFKIAKRKLSSDSSIKIMVPDITYTGKPLKPKPTIKMGSYKLIEDRDYTVGSYKDNRNVTDDPTLKVTGKGNFSGNVTVSFKIVPQPTSLTKLTAGKKQFTAFWKKQPVQVLGYQIQYSTDKSFKKNCITIVAGKKNTVSKIITGLKAKTTYYVRIRTFRYYVSINGKPMEPGYCSKWSAVKSVKTK